MENLSILTDFPESERQQYYKIIAENVAGGYTVYTGGNFVFISNTKNRTVRFTPSNISSAAISASQVAFWVESIKQIYPHF